MIDLLTYISLISGGLLVILLLLSIISGLDFDFELDFDTDTDVDGDGGLGIIKGLLTFVSVGAWTVKLFLASQANPAVAFALGAAAGAVSVWIMSLLLKFLLSQQSNVNWSQEDALFQEGVVYLRIPAAGEGIVNVSVKGRHRELKARSADGLDIPTGASILVEEMGSDGVAIVREASSVA